ncbi:GAF domain-containing protein [Pedobacter sp. PAMC26386]|nr:GAF domain-containing protein [Pedobacter sp. PAMC26386]
MQAITIDFNKYVCGNEENGMKADIRLSLKPFITFLTEKIKVEKTAKINFYNYMLEQFSAFPELMDPIPAENVKKYHHLFELIYTALSPIINDEREQLWALSKPICPCFYYGTNSFYHVLLDDKGERINTDLALPSQKELQKTMMTSLYNLVLQKFYNFSLATDQHIIKSIVDHKTNLLKYYKLIVDTRFVEVTSKTTLPELTLQNVKEYMQDESSSLETLATLLPTEMFRVEGISIVSLVDITEDYALESIKNAIISHNQCQIGWSTAAIATALKSLVGSDLIDFGLLPYLKLNNKILPYQHEGFQSVIIQQAIRNGIEEEAYAALIKNFVANPRRLIFPEINIEEYSTYPMLKLVADAGIKAYAIFPLYYNAKLIGCLELYTKDSSAFNGNTLSKIESAFPLLAQLYQNIIIDFNNEITTIVTDKFTALQSSVEWRFNEAAYNYMQSGGWDRNAPIEPVYFKDVHPFYGAIDIRNSSIERNLMIRKDLFAHFEILETTLGNLKTIIPEVLEDDFPRQESAWDHKGFDEISDREIMKTDDYLQHQLPPYLNVLKEVYPEAEKIITEYFELTRHGGKIFENRDNYENSMQTINRAVNKHLDQFNAELQQEYPCYFEKFRTDGVEFDIYLGHSIAPDIDFKDDLVADFRLRQLKAIAEITRITDHLKPSLAIPMETTQLIFVYEKIIDISFRIDEQRFDVEGSYNIRYQMVKKRIDKAHIKDSTERLTQPGKIAIVYFNNSEADEYMEYIRKLQEQELLTNVVEYLEVEELQGVEGLKALRVEVAIKTD